MHFQVTPMASSGVVRVSYLVHVNLTPLAITVNTRTLSPQILVGAHEPHNQYWDAYTVPRRSRTKTTATPSPVSRLPVSLPTLLFHTLTRTAHQRYRRGHAYIWMDLR